MKLKNLCSNFLVLSLITLGLLIFNGAVVYLAYQLSYFGVIGAVILTLSELLLIIRYLGLNKQVMVMPELSPEKNSSWSYLVAAAYLLFFGLALFYLFKNGTGAALVSPWDLVGYKFFYLYGAATLVLFILIVLKNKLRLFFIVIHYFLTFSVALIVYKIGFGFDPFIHLASLKVIDKFGVITPKTIYYSGQYALEIILHKLFFIPLDFLNRILVPLLAAIVLPSTIYLAAKDKFGDKKIAHLLLLLLLLFPTSIFIMTVPQNLAYLLLLLVVILSFSTLNNLRTVAMMILALAALMVQPIAGLPALLFASYILVQHLNILLIINIKYPSILIANVATIPLLLIFFAGAHLNLTWSNFNFWSGSLAGSQNFGLNFVYFLAFNKSTILTVLVAVMALVAYKNKNYRHYFYFFISSFLAYLLASNLSFSDLAASEQGNYPERLLISALIFLLPLVLIFFKEIIVRVQIQTRVVQAIFLVFTVLLIVTATYLSYPRQDRYFNSHGYSVSTADLEAVKLIAAKATTPDYAVLANQQVGVGAISLYGTKKYYQGDIFYYTTQTGNKLYDYYLQMIGAPQRDTMIAAMNYLGINEMYFVLDKYWWAAPKILAEAKLSANQFWEIDGGEVYVFKYLR